MDQLLFHCLPRIDDAISIWLNDTLLELLPPNYQKNDSDFIILSDVSEEDTDRFMTQVKQRGEELAQFYCSQAFENNWDVYIKPILHFLNFSSALEFHNLTKNGDKDEVYALVGELQLLYNEPWEHVRPISDENWDEIYSQYFAL